MVPKSQNIKNMIKKLESDISDLEKQLSAMIWERDKYIQFSDNNNDNNISDK